MAEATLGELIRSAPIKRAGDEDHPLLSMTMHHGLVPQADRFKKRIASQNVSDYKVVAQGQLVVGFPIDEGVLDFQEQFPTAIVSPAYGVWDVIDDARVERRYLKLALRSSRALAYYASKLRGSTARRRSLPSSVFLSLPISLPPLEEQRRIAAILDAADAIRTKRRDHLARLEALASADFDRISREALSERRLGDVAQLFAGNSLPPGEPFLGQTDGVLLAKVSDMNASGNEVALIATALWTSAPTAPSTTAPRGAVIFPKRGASIATNKKRVAIRPTALDPNLMAVHADAPSLTNEYLFAWFRSLDLSTISSGSAVPQLNKQDLAPLKIPLPSLSDQAAFASRAAAIDAERGRVQRAIAADDELFASLQSRAFSGRL